MAIEHIRFQNCDACGRRFRASGGRIVRAKVLCDECRVRDAQPEPAAQPVLEIPDEELLAGELDINLLDDPPVGEQAGAAVKGPTLEEIAARTPGRQRRLRGDYPALQHLRWPFYAGCVLLLIGIGGMSLWQARSKGREGVVESVGESPFADLPVLPVPGLPGYEESRDLAGRFVSEGDVEAVIGMIRPWPGMEEVVAGFLAENPPVDGAAKFLSDMPPEIQTGIVYQSFGLVLPDGTGRLVQVVNTNDGPKVDFKAYVEWCSVSPDELFSGRIAQADEIRAIVRPSTYYNFEFANSERYLAMTATVSGRKEQLTVYVPRGSDAVEPLIRAVRQIGMHPATFSLQAVGESHQRQQFLLSDLKAIGFVVPEGRGEE